MTLGNAVDSLPADGSLFYLFNPIDEGLLRPFRDAQRQRLRDLSGVRVIYFAPTCLLVWTERPCWRVELFELDLGLAPGHAPRHRRYAVVTAA